MKILITESSFKRLLNELDISSDNTHFIDRSFHRFIGQQFYNVIVRPDDDYTKDFVIGKYKIPQSVKDEVIQKVNSLFQDNIELPSDTLFIVSLYKFYVELNDIKLNGDKKQQEIFKKFYYDSMSRYSKTQLFLKEPPGEVEQNLSTGFHLICYIRKNQFQTMMLSKTVSPSTIVQKARKNERTAKYVVYIDDIEDLFKYMDVDALRLGSQKKNDILRLIPQKKTDV